MYLTVLPCKGKMQYLLTLQKTDTAFCLCRAESVSVECMWFLYSRVIFYAVLCVLVSDCMSFFMFLFHLLMFSSIYMFSLDIF